MSIVVVRCQVKNADFFNFFLKLSMEYGIHKCFKVNNETG